MDRVEEVLTLDPTTYRLTSHRFRCAFVIPSSAGSLRYGQEVTERTKGVFPGTISLPAGVG
ncbi:hypothetical protein [Streptomyces sp. Ru71]|uniref:hypothetical protein n=1 Tax=Streptomyces sp. Ru71 TaxID=2080746 RepID=UPI0011B097A3|nr:hypothetical protein [Streptomyces sp. Ru71]